MGFSNMLDLGMITSSLISLGMPETEAVALYGNYTTLVVPMINLISALIAPMSTASLPELTSSYARNDFIRFKVLSCGIIKICSFITVPVCFYYIFFSKQILGLVFRDSSATVAAPLLSVMAPCVVFIPLLTMLNTLLESSGNQRYPMISMTLGMGMKTVLLLLLIKREGIGIVGAPISTSVAYGAALVLSAVFVNKKLGFSLPILRYTILSFVASVVSFCPAYYIYGRLFAETETYLSFIPTAIACGVMYILLLVVFMPSEIVKLLTYVKSNKKNIKLL
jgi:stage V sporulation protein B